MTTVGNLNRNINGNRPGLGVEQQREAHHADQHQYRRADQPMARTTAHDVDAFHLGSAGTRYGLVRSLFFAEPRELEKCHEVQTRSGLFAQMLGLQARRARDVPGSAEA